MLYSQSKRFLYYRLMQIKDLLVTGPKQTYLLLFTFLFSMNERRGTSNFVSCYTLFLTTNQHNSWSSLSPEWCDQGEYQIPMSKFKAERCEPFLVTEPQSCYYYCFVHSTPFLLELNIKDVHVTTKFQLMKENLFIYLFLITSWIS